MSAPNQVQASPARYYEDDYEQNSMIFTATTPSLPLNLFTTAFRWNRVGNKVTVQIFPQVPGGAGTDTTIQRYTSTANLVPAAYRPSAVRYGAVMFSNTAGIYFQAGFCAIEPSGQVQFYPENANFNAGSYVLSGTFSYFI